MAKKTTNTKSSTKKTNKTKNEVDVIAKTSELIIENGEVEPVCVASIEPPVLDDNTCIASIDTINNEDKNNSTKSSNLSLMNKDLVYLVDKVNETITLPCDGSILHDSNGGQNKIYETNIINDMNIKELMVYKDAIEKLITYHTNLCEMNRGYNVNIYSESASTLNKLQSFFSKINDAIKNKIFSLE